MGMFSASSKCTTLRLPHHFSLLPLDCHLTLITLITLITSPLTSPSHPLTLSHSHTLHLHNLNITSVSPQFRKKNENEEQNIKILPSLIKYLQLGI
jgi:hypothetical protein